jgi:hypothetical protein
LTEQDHYPIEPHRYSPSLMHMGDCKICGHLGDSPLHTNDERDILRGRIVAAARQFRIAHDRILASAIVTRDDTYAMKNAADALGALLDEYDR